MADPVIRGNSLYTVVDGPSWTQAEANSVKLGGHLASINSREENIFLRLNFDLYDSSTGGPTNPHGVWIGLYDSEQNGSWKWKDGSSPQSNGWSNWEPTTPTPQPDFIGSEIVVKMQPDRIGSWQNATADWIAYSNTGIAENTFIRRGDSAYVVVQGPTWEEAETNAVKLGGHLVTINDSAENTWLHGTYNIGYTGDNAYYYTGLTDKDVEGTWSWTSGEQIDYLNWYYTEPNGANGLDDEDYGMLVWFTSNEWQDASNRTYFTPSGLPPIIPDNKLLGIAEIKLAPNIDPTGTPTLAGTIESGKTINIDKTGVQDADNIDGYTPDYQYAWEVAKDPGMTTMMPVWESLNTTDATDGNNSIVLTEDLEGKLIRGVVKYMDGHGTNEVVQTDDTKISGTEPTYTVIHSPTRTVSEGATLTTALQTTDVEEGETIYWTADGEDIDEDDFSEGELSGEGTVDDQGKFSFSHTLANDETTEGNETLQFSFYSDSDHANLVGRRSTITVADTSKSSPTYTVSQSSTGAVEEGETLTTTVETTELEEGTEVYWSASGEEINEDDFTDGELTGSALVDEDGTFSFSRTLANDNTTEGNETLKFKLYSDSARTTQVGETIRTTINDTSRDPEPIVRREYGDAYASVNENLARGAHSLVGMRYQKLNVDGDGDFESDIDSASDTSATTGNGSASTTSRHSLLGIELNGSSRIGGEGRFASIVTHESDNQATATNGTADSDEEINSVSVDVSDVTISGRSSFGSYMSVGATNRADASQSRAGVLLTDATATLNQDLASGERNITGMRFERLSTGDRATFSSEIENTIDTSASSDKGDATALSRNSVLGVGFSGTNRIGGDSRVTAILEHNSFNDAQSVHGTATADDHLAVIGVEVDTLTVNGNATFSSTVVVRAGANSGV